MHQPSGSGEEAGEGGGEDQEESSSSSLLTMTTVEDALTSFREQWERELKFPSKTKTTNLNSTVAENTEDAGNLDLSSIENRAKNLFLNGIEHERMGKLYEAIQFYKRAVQLVPDIEVRLYESTKSKSKERAEELLENDNDESRGSDEERDENGEITDGGVDLFAKLSKIVCRNQCVCFPKFQQNTTHISALPMEIVLYILRWVVSSELDLRSLEMFSRVCRGFYIPARDAEIWRLACVRVWGVNCGHYEPKYQSWREMYLQRPRLRYNGCYISKTTYIRHGENSFQDQFYRPWHLVEYFRYLRFFPEGRVLMLTSTEEMQICVSYLKCRNPRNPQVLMGHYRLHDNCVTLLLRKQDKSANINYRRKQRREIVHDSGEQTFQIEFEIQSQQKKINTQLTWLRYNIYTKYNNGQEGTTCFTLGGKYPPFKFSRVKSYTQESEAPLQ